MRYWSFSICFDSNVTTAYVCERKGGFHSNSLHGDACTSNREEGETLPSITQEGFQFLLMDTSSQVWYFLLQYLDTVHSRGLDLVSCLSFLFQLSFSTLGKVGQVCGGWGGTLGWGGVSLLVGGKDGDVC